MKSNQDQELIIGIPQPLDLFVQHRVELGDDAQPHRRKYKKISG